MFSQSYRLPRTLIGVIFVALLLVACAEDDADDADRRFANHPVTPDPETGLATESVDILPTTPPEAPVSLEELLAVRGASPVASLVVDGRAGVIDLRAPGAVTWIDPPRDHRVVASVVRPDGEAVAVISLADDEGGSAIVAVHDASGDEVDRWELPPIASTNATPVVNGEPLAGRVPATWSRGGDSLLVLLPGDRLVLLAENGASSEVEVPENASGIEFAAISPAGDRIAVLTRTDTGQGRILTFRPDGEAQRATQIVPPAADTEETGSAGAVAWLPNGTGFVYTMSRDLTESRGGSLYGHHLDSGESRLIATPGRGGPSALIVDFLVAPDGRSVAYVIAAPEGDGLVFDSLWVRSMESNQAFEVPVPGGVDVTGLWWSASGLIWSEMGGDGEIRLRLLSWGEDVRTIARYGGPEIATPVVAATPILATPEIPAATPDAGGTPAATPIVATPEIPAATPIADGTPVEATPAIATPAS